MNRIAISIVLATLALVGCVDDRAAAEQDPAPALPAPEHDPVLAEACEAASERWGTSTGVAFDCTSVSLAWRTPEELGEECDDFDGTGEVTCRQVGGMASARAIVVDTDSTDVLSEIMLHEVGHKLAGRGEHPEEGQALYRFVVANARINEADLEWVCGLAPCTTFAPEMFERPVIAEVP